MCDFITLCMPEPESVKSLVERRDCGTLALLLDWGAQL